MHPVVIQGCGRSGTSILGELFEHLPQYNYLFEPSIEELEKVASTSETVLACKVPKGGENVSPGLASDMDKVTQVLPEGVRYIWIVRNPLDAVCSLKPGIEANWSHNPKPPNYKELQNEEWHIKSAYHWKHINEVGFETLKRYGDVHVVRYRDLLDSPQDVVNGILDFLNVEHNLNLLTDYFAKISNRVEGSYHAKKQVYWFRKDHTKRKDRYKENLTASQIEEVIQITSDVSEKFGFNYKLSTN